MLTISLVSALLARGNDRYAVSEDRQLAGDGRTRAAQVERVLAEQRLMCARMYGLTAATVSGSIGRPSARSLYSASVIVHTM